MAGEIIDLDKSNIPEVPSVYYGATSNLISNIDPKAGTLMARATFPANYTPGVEFPLLSIK